MDNNIEKNSISSIIEDTLEQNQEKKEFVNSEEKSNKEKNSFVAKTFSHSRYVQNGDRSTSGNNKRKFGSNFGPNNNTNTMNKKPFGGANNSNSLMMRGPKDDFISETLEIRRVAKTTTGGKKLSFSALVAIGNKDGTIGIGKGKDAEVSKAINKALNDARKKLIRIARFKTTIIHDVQGNFKATNILIKKARKGTGCIACNVVKVIFRLGGVEDVVAKVNGSSNLNNVVKATIVAIEKLESPKSIALRRNKSLEEILNNIGIKMNSRKIIPTENNKIQKNNNFKKNREIKEVSKER
jgi:small subunit ribosomal protein S5